jgi:hypothetical protein
MLEMHKAGYQCRNQSTKKRKKKSPRTDYATLRVEKKERKVLETSE